MKEVEEKLIEIIKAQLEQCEKNSTVPSKEVLDTVNTLIKIHETFYM